MIPEPLMMTPNRRRAAIVFLALVLAAWGQSPASAQYGGSFGQNKIAHYLINFQFTL